jgi:hypothetical protein
MSTRLALILTGVWTLLVVAGCGGALWFVTTKAPRHQQEERARRLGTGMAAVAGIGYGAIWLPWAVVWGRKRREQLAAQARREDRETGKRSRRRP